jgi:hypothetical protein
MCITSISIYKLTGGISFQMYFPGFQSISLWDKFITCVFARFSICTSPVWLWIEMLEYTCAEFDLRGVMD